MHRAEGCCAAALQDMIALKAANGGPEPLEDEKKLVPSKGSHLQLAIAALRHLLKHNPRARSKASAACSQGQDSDAG